MVGIGTKARAAFVAVGLVAGVALAACGSDGGGTSTPTTAPVPPTLLLDPTTTVPEGGATTTTTTEAATTTTTEPPATTTTTTGPSAPRGSNGRVLRPGGPCPPGTTEPDCVDVDGDGLDEYLLGGADCVARSPDPTVCQDVDGDGRAG
jgi:hypothetical protein